MSADDIKGITLPRMGETLTLAAHGATLHVRKTKAHTWIAGVEGSPRRRFGNTAEMRGDVAHFLDTGALPISRGGWA